MTGTTKKPAKGKSKGKGIETVETCPTPKSHKVTAQQCAAIGYDLTKSEVPNAHEIYVQSEGEPALDAAGNLTFDYKVYSPQGIDITELTPALEKHEVTPAQGKAIGLTPEQATQPDGSVDYHYAFCDYLSDGKTELDSEGNLPFKGKLYAPDGKEVVAKNPAKDKKNAAANGTPAQEKKGGEKLNEYEKALARVQGFATMTKSESWTHFFARAKAMQANALRCLQDPEECKSTKDLAYFQARVKAPPELMEVIKEACNALNRLSKPDEFPGLFTTATPATAQFNDETGLVSIIGGEPISEAVKKALKGDAKDEGATGPPVDPKATKGSAGGKKKPAKKPAGGLKSGKPDTNVAPVKEPVEVPTAKKEAAAATG